MAADNGEIVLNEFDEIDSAEKAYKWIEFRKTASRTLLSNLAFHREERSKKAKNSSEYHHHDAKVQSYKEQIIALQALAKRKLASAQAFKAREEQILASLPPEENNPFDENEENLVPNPPRCMRT